MKTRLVRALHIPLLILMVASASFAGAEEAYSRPVEIRGVWMDRGSIPATEQGMRDLVRSYARAGINVLHPEIVFNGYSAYPSSYLTQQDLWNGLDMPAIIIDEAHKQGMEVHPWVWIFRTGHADDMGGILRRHPEWAAVGRDGETLAGGTSYWLCPSIPAVRRLILNVVREVAERYPVDGIELDYIRFSNPDHCYNDSCRTRFLARYGIDPLEIQPFTQPVIDWQLWREELVNSFVAEAQAVAKRARPGVKISAAVASNPDLARTNYLQHWEHWAANKWVDYLAPMDYTGDSGYFRRVVTRSDNQIVDRTLLAPGIGLHLQQGAGPMLEQVRITREVPVSGSTLFATAYFDEERIRSLAEGPFRKNALLPFRSPLEGARRLMDSVSERLKAGATEDDLALVGSEIEAARSLVRYASYQMRDVGYVSPQPLSIYIPEQVIPVPEASVPRVTASPAIDGVLDDDVWKTAARISIDYTNLGDGAPQPTDVYLARDAEKLYIAYRAHEPELGRIRAAVTQRDGPVFQDDSLEFFLDVDPDSAGYLHFAVNAIGTQYDARNADPRFSLEWEAATGREPGAWTAEISIPLSSLGEQVGDTWKANFCRNRVLGREASEVRNMCWSPTYGPYHTPIRFGLLDASAEVR